MLTLIHLPRNIDLCRDDPAAAKASLTASLKEHDLTIDSDITPSGRAIATVLGECVWYNNTHLGKIAIKDFRADPMALVGSRQKGGFPTFMLATMGLHRTAMAEVLVPHLTEEQLSRSYKTHFGHLTPIQAALLFGADDTLRLLVDAGAKAQDSDLSFMLPHGDGVDEVLVRGGAEPFGNDWALSKNPVLLDSRPSKY